MRVNDGNKLQEGVIDSKSVGELGRELNKCVVFCILRRQLMICGACEDGRLE